MPRPIPPFRADQREGTADHGIAASEARDATQQLVGPLLGRLDALERRVADLEGRGHTGVVVDAGTARPGPTRAVDASEPRPSRGSIDGPPPLIGPPAWRRPPTTSPVPPRWRFWERR